MKRLDLATGLGASALLAGLPRRARAAPKVLRVAVFMGMAAYDRLVNSDPAARIDASCSKRVPPAFIVHDMKPRALAPNVKGLVRAQSSFQDLTRVYLT